MNETFVGKYEQNVEVVRMEIAKLEMRPGDVLVVRSSQRLSQEAMTRIGDVVRKAVPGQRVMVVDPGTEFLLLRQNKATAMDVVKGN